MPGAGSANSTENTNNLNINTNNNVNSPHQYQSNPTSDPPPLLVAVLIAIPGALAAAESGEGGGGKYREDLPNAEVVPSSTMLLIGDTVVVWRAWVLLPEGKFWKILLAVLMMANIGLNIADCVVNEIASVQILQGFAPILDWISITASFILNAFSTLFIMWKWRTYQNFLKKSGAIFCTAQALYLIATVLENYDYQNSMGFLEAVHVMGSFFGFATPSYPAAVIILVKTGNSPVAETVQYNQSTINAHNDALTGDRQVRTGSLILS
ncbi:hypothetical protein GYMLUDRAFT_245830 [Collybiopsis luxurians FD-317 M1]|uniref:Uncharacterized protein n=1 Tax=Collybiopsis luxurians FD-317 M1 TaxID=944289 RepID=A0A0D0CJY8_9AGAR|nr:hypothetical protein GYMLUDRAFT_245830 [Collybiopsis luxurians FD-317 M1]